MRASMVAILISDSRTRSAVANDSSATSSSASPRHSSRAPRRLRAASATSPSRMRLAAARRQPLEAKRVNGVSVDGEYVALAPPHHGIGSAKQAPKRGDLPLQGVGTRPKLVAPQDLAEAVVGHHLPAPQRESDDQARQPCASNRDEVATVVDDLERTENTDLQAASYRSAIDVVPPARPPLQGRQVYPLAHIYGDAYS